VRRRVLMTTTAYPPSIGGVQSYVADLCAHLESFEADIVSLWLEHRTDWLLGTTVRLGEVSSDAVQGVHRLGWSRATRTRMAPWVLAYYAAVPVAARRIASQMTASIERLLTSEHALIHNHRIGREFLAQASLTAARNRGIPFVLTPHHHPRWNGYRYSGWTNVYRAANAVLAITQAEVIELQALGVARERIHVVGGAADDPMPADAKRFRARIGGSPKPIVLFVGQLYPYKGVGRLVEAGEALHARGFEIEVVFIGPETPFSRRLFASHRRPWLHVLGAVDNQTKWDAYEAASVLCLPSAQEAFGRVYLEAWSKSKPVIGGRIPAVEEVVKDEKTGLLVDPSSSSELEHALERLLSDQDLAARLGAAGRREVDERFNWHQVAARVEGVYEDLLARAATSTGRAK
jgi:glycosyltransferase involved in cell wall biosynthesis